MEINQSFLRTNLFSRLLNASHHGVPILQLANAVGGSLANIFPISAQQYADIKIAEQPFNKHLIQQLLLS